MSVAMHFSILHFKKLMQLRSMILNQSDNTTAASTQQNYTTSFQSNRIKFFMFLGLQLLVVPCFLYGFYQFIQRKKLRETINYHVIYLLLLTSFLFVTVALPLTQAYMFTSYVYPSSDAFCGFWNWFHYSLNIINLFLMAFVSIERNILIFYSKFLRSKRAKVLFHYSPIVFCLFYPPIFYIGAIFIHTCSSDYDYTQLLCAWPCYFDNIIWTNIDLFFNNYAPLIIIPVFCMMLYTRVFFQRRSMQRHVVTWRRNRKLIIQVWAISSLYLAAWMPVEIPGMINLFWDRAFLLQFQIDYIYLFPYFVHIIYPFIVLFMIRSKDVQRDQPIARTR
jgi:hypothetical protein